MQDETDPYAQLFEEGRRQATWKPDEYRDQNQIIGRMTQAHFTDASRASHSERLKQALNHIRQSDTTRLMSQGPLTSPFDKAA